MLEVIKKRQKCLKNTLQKSVRLKKPKTQVPNEAHNSQCARASEVKTMMLQNSLSLMMMVHRGTDITANSNRLLWIYNESVVVEIELNSFANALKVGCLSILLLLIIRNYYLIIIALFVINTSSRKFIFYYLLPFFVS